MRTRSKLALIGLGAAILMAFALSSASARNFSISNQQIRAPFNNLEFFLEGIQTTTCRVTLEGSLHERTIPKTANILIGNITRVITGQCNPAVTVLTETLPWNIRYVGFSGRLPNITLILIQMRPFFNVAGPLGTRCLSEEDIIGRFIRNTATGQITGASLPLTEVRVRSGGGFGCPVETGRFRSAEDGRVFLLGNTNLIFVTLI
jgi:hypothetical protein